MMATGGKALEMRNSVPALLEKAADSYLLCMLDGGMLGIEALAVREVLPLPLVTPLREAPPLVAGVVNVRGALVPVIDVRGVLGMAPQRARLTDAMVVLERSGELAAIIVSEVCDVRALSARTIENSPMSTASGHGIVGGLAMVGDEIVQLLRVESLLHLGDVPRESRADNLKVPTSALTSSSAQGLFLGVEPEELEIFATRARSLIRDLTRELEVHAAQTRLVAAFALGGEFFGLELEVVREFSPLRSVSPVPCSPPYIAGLMNLRGETLTLVDIGPTLGLSPTPVDAEKAKVVVTQCEGLRIGLIVDEVLDIISVSAAQIAPAMAHPVGKSEGEIVRGAVFFRDKMLGIIDLPRLLASDALGANL
jgi:purine-binding chemotaxis protein CheW